MRANRKNWRGISRKYTALTAQEQRHILLNAGRISPYAIATLLGRDTKTVANWIFNNYGTHVGTQTELPAQAQASGARKGQQSCANDGTVTEGSMSDWISVRIAEEVARTTTVTSCHLL
jgi:hypothetical protein